MIVTIDKVRNALTRYIEQDLSPVITDKGFQVAVTFFSEIIKQANLDSIEVFLREPMIASLVPWNEEAKGYDITKLMSVLKNTINHCTVLPVKIPAIPLISPEEKEIKFLMADVEKIEQYLKI